MTNINLEAKNEEKPEQDSKKKKSRKSIYTILLGIKKIKRNRN